jgi:hypothetical protein
MATMSDQILLKKLNLKPSETVRLINAPAGYDALFSPLPDGSEPIGDRQADVVMLFVVTHAELATFAPVAIGAMKPGGRLWVAYPKKSSGVASDLHRDASWSPLTDSGFRPVSMLAVNKVWTAFRFRPLSETKPLMGTSMRPSGDRSELAVPADLAALLAQNADANAIFDKLAYTHRKEYIRWIEEAKKPETREARLQKTLVFLTKGKPAA